MRGERGEIGLAQLLVAMVIFAGVLGATLVTFQGFERLNRDANERNAAQDNARTAVDALSRKLRNLASPTPQQPQAVDRASSYDIVFQTVNANGPNTGLNAANVERVRYCLDISNPNNEKLWTQEQTWTTLNPPAAPSDVNCPGTGWDNQRIVASYITNRINGQDRPVFSFNSYTSLSDIDAIHVDLYVDDTPTHAPVASRLSSGVFLRNQNRRPTASFTATPSAKGIVLNGSVSADPEGEPLNYVWYDGTTKIGAGITFTYTATAGTSHNITLKVFDPAGLEGDYTISGVVA
jgi:type II secretory pathway pseudopilin PulG